MNFEYATLKREWEGDSNKKTTTAINDILVIV